LSSLIFLNVVAAVIETLPELYPYRQAFHLFESCSVIIFTVEYLLRVWVAPERAGQKKKTDENREHVQENSSSLKERLRYIRSPLALIDLLTILPFYLPFLGIDLRVLRLFRLLRVFKFARYSQALQIIGRVFVRKRPELVLTTFVMLILLVLASSIVYYVENEAQPDTFSSIPAAMWWGVATVTTVGYGDIYPVTPFGKLFTAIIALLGVALLALPTGIIASGFSEEQEVRNSERTAPKNSAVYSCPHCHAKFSLSPHDESGHNQAQRAAG